VQVRRRSRTDDRSRRQRPRLRLQEGFAVDENFQPLDSKPRGHTQKSSWKRLRINHYYIKSKEQWLAKTGTEKADTGRRRGYKNERYAEHAAVFSQVQDDTIQAYLPALRAALGGKAPVDATRPS
jgi:hypothetical protein